MGSILYEQMEPASERKNRFKGCLFLVLFIGSVLLIIRMIVAWLGGELNGFL